MLREGREKSSFLFYDEGKSVDKEWEKSKLLYSKQSGADAVINVLAG